MFDQGNVAKPVQTCTNSGQCHYEKKCEPNEFIFIYVAPEQKSTSFRNDYVHKLCISYIHMLHILQETCFLNALRNIRLSLDASRVGCRNRLLVFIARPGGYGGWLPPQDKCKRRLLIPKTTKGTQLY